MKANLDFVRPMWKLFGSKISAPHFELKTKDLGKLNISVFNKSSTPDRFSCRIHNSDNILLGATSFDYDNGLLSDFLMHTHSDYRGRGIGELLHLINVMIMDKNNIGKMNLYSKNSAIYFHGKYKFVPDVHFKERNLALETISKEKEPKFADLVKKAKLLLKKINSGMSKEEESLLDKSANECINEYMQRVLEEGNYNKHPFSNGFSMKLSKERINDNQNFFNKLFEKHNIDYFI